MKVWQLKNNTIKNNAPIRVAFALTDKSTGTVEHVVIN